MFIYYLKKFDFFFLFNSEMYIVDGEGGWRGKDVLTYTGTSLPPVFTSTTNRVGVLFFYDLTPNTGAMFNYSVAAGTTDTVDLLEAIAPVAPPLVQDSGATILTVIRAILRGLFSINV